MIKGVTEKENLISVLDFIGHISENIENIEFDCLSKYLMSITPKSLKYAKALSEMFPKLDQCSELLLSRFNHKINHDSRWDVREPHLNKLDLPPEEFIGIANLLNSQNRFYSANYDQHFVKTHFLLY